MGSSERWARVPGELKALRQWVCWRWEERDGKRTKVPLSPATGRMAKSTDPATWGTFAEAVDGASRPGRDGIGFVFAPDRAFTGLDLDHVLHGGELEEEYRWAVEESGTYCEVSPSGDGLHLIFEGGKPEWATRSRRGPVEMYDHGRFFTVTGDVFEGHGEIAANADVLGRAYREWVGTAGEPPRERAAGPVPGALSEVGDAELVERMLASKSGEAIRRLMSGDTTGYTRVRKEDGAVVEDRSAADMALCSHLAFWCAGDAARMDRIFRSSGLMRPKWDRARGGRTYGEITIETALARATEFYEPRRRADRRPGRRRSDPGGGDGSACPAVPAARGEDGVNANACSTVPVSRADDGEEAFDPGRAPSVEGWKVDERGRLWQADADGELRRSVTSTAPWVACDLVDVDTRDVRALVRMRTPGGLRERALDREAIMSQNKIVAALAPMGGNVSSSNAKDVVRYLTDCERRLGELRPRSASVTHLGWADAPLGAFMPYDRDGGDVRFDPAPDALPKSRPFMEPAGTLGEWVEAMRPVREKSPAFRAVMAASFASPLVAVLGVQTFIVYLWGRSRSGKTPTLKAAGSVWGDPSEGADGYYRTFADTPKSIVRAAALLHDVPLVVDELQSKGAPGGQAGKRQLVEDLLYSLSLGHERGALNADRSMMRAGSWSCLALATGEIPIVGGSTQQGAANRTLELNAEPFSDPREAQAMHRLVAEQHGTAGRTYVRALRRHDRKWYRRTWERCRSAVAAAAHGHPQADNVALLAMADAMAESCVFSPGKSWEECCSGAADMALWALASATGAEGGDTDLKAVQFLAEWLARNRVHFEASAELDRVERYGSVEQRLGAGDGDFTWCVFSSVLDRALSQAGYDRRKTLRRMADEGLLVTAGHGFTCQRRFPGGGRVYCVCVENAALESFLGLPTRGDAGEPEPSCPSQEALPC